MKWAVRVVVRSQCPWITGIHPGYQREPPARRSCYPWDFIPEYPLRMIIDLGDKLSVAYHDSWVEKR